MIYVCESFEKQVACNIGGNLNIGGHFYQVMLTAMTLALPPHTNIPTPKKKNPKDTPNHHVLFNKVSVVSELWDRGSTSYHAFFMSTAFSSICTTDHLITNVTVHPPPAGGCIK